MAKPCKLSERVAVSMENGRHFGFLSGCAAHDVREGGVVYRQKKGGGRKRAVTAQCEVRLKMATAGLRQISRSCSVASQNLYFSNVAPKILEKAENAHTHTHTHTKKKIRATRSRLVYRDDAEGDWASRCRRRESTSRRQAKKLQPLRKPLSASV